jgi:uncharacterized protein
MKYLPKTKQKEVVDAVKKIYDDLGKRCFERNCRRRTECCQFNLTGKTPFLTLGEALVAANAFRASGRKKLPQTEICPMLDKNKCVIYEHRPFGCRTHFCEEAGGDIPRRNVADLIRMLEEIDAHFFQASKSGMHLPQAVRMFL